tara:strand:+ start:5581 stop:5853 length:273 start_codon:yes stop_codon:yes gene_type:complete
MKKRNRNIIIGLVIILLIYMFIIKPMIEKSKKTTNGNGNGNGNTPLMVDCCWCDGGSPICNQFEQGMCPDGTSEMSQYEALDCGHGNLGA